MALFLAIVGVLAGALTTFAGMGGGLMLVVVLSIGSDPRTALVTSAPALLVGNLHRLYLYRRALDRDVALRFVLGAVPGSLLGGTLLAVVPAGTVTVLTLGTTALAVARAFGLVRLTTPRWALAPAAFAIGGLAATAGGAAVLVAPVLMAAGLAGDAYLATVAAAAVAMHAGRIAAYGGSGLFAGDIPLHAAWLTVFILVGNLVGKRLRGRLAEGVTSRIEVGALVVSAALGLVGLGR